MGVPQFFHWLVTHYEKHLLHKSYPRNDGARPEYLYLDFNCGIHPAVKRPELVGKEKFDTLDEMYDAVCVYLDKIVDAVQPTKLIYIAIDGVAPVAKMKQQRMRRFKAVQDRRELDRIDTKHQCYTKSKFDYNMISPGTEFMRGLTIRLEQHLLLMKKKTDAQIILSDASQPGEGEHKITHHLRSQVDPDASVVIYGLDSDLIFLSLLHYRDKFCLFREKIFFDGGANKTDEYTYFDIGAFRKILLTILTPELTKQALDDWGVLNSDRVRALNGADMIDMDHFGQIETKAPDLKSVIDKDDLDDYADIDESGKDKLSVLEKNSKFDLSLYRKDLNLSLDEENRLIVDYSAMCFILGNDFLPHLPSLKIKEGGLNRVIECYKLTQAELKGQNLVKDMEYNFDFLISLLMRLRDYENIDLAKYTEASETRRHKFKNGYRLKGLTPHEKDMKLWEYIENQYHDSLRLGSDGWKERYYQHYLGEKYQSLVNLICEDYLRGMSWTLRYYLGNHCANDSIIDTCPDWKWQYDFAMAPPVSCLVKFITDGLGRDFLKQLKFNSHAPLIADQQLMLIFPPQSKSLVNPRLSNLMTNLDSPIITQYPINFQIDRIGHRYRWECHPILPPIDLEQTCQLVNLVLSK